MRKFKHQKRSRKAAPQPLGPVQQYQVEGITHEGKGVARQQGKVTFIADALPNETVTAQVTKSNKRYDEAKLVTIEQPSEDRQAPECEHFTQCGGCSFQHLAITQQRNAKQQWLKKQLAKVWPIDRDISVLAGDKFGYRRRARVAVKTIQGNTHIGFRGLSSSQIIDIHRCVVLTPRLQQVFTALKQQLSQSELASKVGHVELLEDDLGASVLIRLTADVNKSLRKQWQAWAEQQQLALYWQFLQQDKALVETAQRRAYAIGNLTLGYHPQDFIQVNAQINQQMIEQAMQWLDLSAQDRVLDLFCGVGNFSLPLAQHAQQVLGVEVQQTMVDAAKANAELNHIANVEFVAADLTQAPSQAITAFGATKVLLDPPRAGALAFLPSLVQLKPSSILYVSCDGATLARDAAYLIERGYRITRASMMDMFPQTSHVETMLLFER